MAASKSFLFSSARLKRRPASMASMYLPLLLSMLVGCAAAATFRLEIHHRFSDHMRRWAESRPAALPPGWAWPSRGTPEYYAALAAHDRALRGRALSVAPSRDLTFATGNATLRFDSLGYLHYAMVSVGTPAATFLVALDTGSDLFWLPCDCTRCAPASSSAYGYNQEFEFSIYSPSMSSTSQRVPCNSSLCEIQSDCPTAANQCPYKIAYVSADTSSSGILVEDVLYLTTEDDRLEVVEAHIIFGCGQVQTGSFLNVAAPNGLFGLGMEKISVPSLLATTGLTSDSFSMCFGPDGVGRISFGDKGSSDQEETPFTPNQEHPTYNISITGMAIGSSLIDTEFSALFDSGTSFTYLADPFYTHLSGSFDSQVLDKRHAPDTRIPFEYCYDMSFNSTQIPSVTLTARGGSQFPVSEPTIIIPILQRESVYCLAVLKSNTLNIIGQNFMTGMRIVFDRERMILGWKQFNCYDVEESSSLPIYPQNSSVLPPTISVGPSSYNPEAAKENGNNSQITVWTPPFSHASHLNIFARLILVVFLLPLAIH